MSCMQSAPSSIFENALQEKSKQGNEMVLGLVQSLGAAMVYPEATNVETNRKLWNLYAKEWSPATDWVQEMSGHLPEDGEPKADDGGSGEQGSIFVGDEWSRASDLAPVIDEYISAFVTPDSIVAEIGCGGGRIAARVHALVASLTCFDISDEMLKRAKLALSACPNVEFALLEDSRLPDSCTACFDFIYSFDVFVHLDLHTIWSYFQQIANALKPGGKAFVSTASLTRPAGWERFTAQSRYTVGGFYFIGEDTVRLFASRVGLRLVKESPEGGDPSNIYINRDYLVVFEKTVE